MTEHELNGLKDLPTPSPRKGAKEEALRAALEAFETKSTDNSPARPQGFPRRARRSHTTSNFPRRRMMSFSRTTYAAAASIAVLTVAVPTALYLNRNDINRQQAGQQGVAGQLSMFTGSDDRSAGEARPIAETAGRRDSEKKDAKIPVVSAPSTTEADLANKPALIDQIRPQEAKEEVARLSKVGATEGMTQRPPVPAADGRSLTTASQRPVSGVMPLGGNNAAQQRMAINNRYESIVNGFVSAPGYHEKITALPDNRDRFEGAAVNPVKQVAAEPVSTFSVDVDTSSYSFVRRSLNAGRLPPKDAVRVEELVNYFSYDYPRPATKSEPFKPTVSVVSSPWNKDRQLVHIGLKGYELENPERPRANLVFLIDVSGSMASADKLALLKQGLLMLLDKLRPDDSVGIVTYASGSGVALEPTKLSDKAKIQSAIEQLGAGGSTAGAQGIQDAYRLAEKAFDKEAVNRVVLGTDGDFNVGITDQGQLKSFIEGKRKTGIFLSVLGFGQGNYNDALMQALAQNGNGTAAYIDTLSEARKVLIEEASSTLFPIAKDVKIQIEFNPAVVRDYRLIGYETRALHREDFNNDKIDAGDVGSGHAVTAIYEITPVGADVKTVDDLRYQKPAEAVPATATPAENSNETAIKPEELAFLKLRYKLPNEEVSKLLTMPVMIPQPLGNINTAPVDARFAVAVAAFGQLLRGDPWIDNKYGYGNVISLANSAKGDDPFGLRAQFIELARLAYVLSSSGYQSTGHRIKF